MNYEEKYKQALERAREMSALPTDKATIEYIFPELKESEDEKIRKSIIAILDNYIDDDNTIKPVIMNWLEKQGKALNPDKVIEWLRFHIQVDEPKIEYNEDGQPFAESFIAHAKARCMAADEVVKQFKKDFEL